jgi:NADH:ubiquinone oxidoreductase subunit E
MSFHPLMVYDSAHFQKSERARLDEGKPFEFTRERRAVLDDMLTKYPPDQKRSAVLGALYLVQEQEGYLTANGMRHVAGILDMTAAEVEDVATYYVMFFRAPVGKYVLQVCRTLSCALGGAERVTEALSEKLGIKDNDWTIAACSLLEVRVRSVRSHAPIVMVNNEHWHEKATPESCAKLVDDIKARGGAAVSGCHLR